MGVLALLGLAAWAAPTGSIAVTVVEEHGRPLSGATLGLARGARPVDRTQLSDEDGHATFAALRPGRYRLVVAGDGFPGRAYEGIRVARGQTTEVNARLERNPGAPMTSPPRSSDTLDRDLLARLPVGGTLPMALQALRGAGGPLGDDPQISGNPSDRTVYVLDGALVTDPVTGGMPLNVPLSGIEAVQLAPQGFLAAYPGAAAGQVSVDTLAPRNPLEARVAVEALGWRRVSARLTGALVRDRAWLALAHENIASGDFDGHAALMRLQVQPDTAHQVEATVLANATPQARGVLAVQRWRWFPSPYTRLDTTAAAQRTHVEADERFAANAETSLFGSFRDPLWGAHELRVGVQASHAAWSTDGAPRASSDKLGGYVQDAWRPTPRATLHLGARFDALELRDGAGDVVLSGGTASPRVGMEWRPDGKTDLALVFGRATDTGRLTWVDEDRATAPRVDELALSAGRSLVEDLRVYAIATARRRSDEASASQLDVGVHKLLAARWEVDAAWRFTPGAGHAARGFVAWDLPADPFTLQATAFALYTDVPATDRDVVRVLAPEPYVRTGERGFVGASLLQHLPVRRGRVVLRLEASSALPLTAPRFLLGAEYAR